MKNYDNAIFFPAISISTHKTIIQNNWKINGLSPRFYLNGMKSSEQMFHHPYILTSAGHNYKEMDFMKSIGINDLHKDVDMIFGDSGGYQIARGEIKGDVNLDDFYAWMEHNSTVAPIIDNPPWNTTTSDIQNSAINQAIQKTKDNIDILLKRPLKQDFAWLNVVHGNDYTSRVHWYNQVKDYQFYNGWALGSLRKNAYVILEAFSTLLDNGELERDRCKLIHFFALTATQYMPYAIYLKYKINERGYKTNISFDSSYATQNGGWGKYLIFPSSSGFTSYHLSNTLYGKFKDVPLPCSCPICNTLKLGDILNAHACTNEGESLFYNAVQSHNVLMIAEYVKNLHSIIYTGSYELMATALKSHQLRIFKVIDKMFKAPQGSAYQVLEENKICFKVHENDSGVEDINEDFEG